MQDLRSESERLNEVKGHLEIALLEKHFLREYLKNYVSLYSMWSKSWDCCTCPVYARCFIHTYRLCNIRMVFGVLCILIWNLPSISVSDPNDSVMLFRYEMLEVG